MKQSRNTGKVSTALSKAQGEFKTLVADKSGYNFKYVTLGNILDNTLNILSKHNLSIIQTSEVELVNSSPWVRLTSRLSCEDEYIEAELFFPMILPTKKTDTDIMMLGSTVTYLRRIALQSILGISGLDRDIEDIQNENIQLQQQG